jgi:O-methyltransferase
MNVYDRYIELMKRVLMDGIYQEEGDPTLDGGTYAKPRRDDGLDWPSRAHTMIGRKRLDNVHACVEAAVRNNIPGDVMETGVWRGGATILMTAILEGLNDTSRRVWVADSFKGLPPPKAEFAADAGDTHHEFPALAISLRRVRENFSRYGLLNDRVVFLEGFFSDTLPTCEVEQLCVLRLDGDMYESTIVALESLYDKISPGGYLIVDDFGAVKGCELAVEEFRAKRGITEPMLPVDWTGVYWQKRA